MAKAITTRGFLGPFVERSRGLYRASLTPGIPPCRRDAGLVNRPPELEGRHRAYTLPGGLMLLACPDQPPKASRSRIWSFPEPLWVCIDRGRDHPAHIA